MSSPSPSPSSATASSSSSPWSAWSNSLVSALEKTGDVLSQAATNAGKSARQNAAVASASVTASLADEATATVEREEAERDPQSAAARYAAAVLQRVERSTAKLRLSQEAEGGGIPVRQEEEVEGDEGDHPKEDSSMTASADVLLKNLQLGWTSFAEQTSKSVKVAQEKTSASLKVAQERLQREQEKLQQSIQKARFQAAFYQHQQQQRRNITDPLDVQALKDASVVYVTDRILTMSHPAMPSAVNGTITAERKLAAVAHLLHKRHDGRFMVWNLSEVEYDMDCFDDQVLAFSFPGSPSPPLGLLLKLLLSMESWLKADPRNVAVLHCLTGKGRTSTVTAAFLCWMGEAGFSSSQHHVDHTEGTATSSSGGGGMKDALAYIAQCKLMTPEELTIPSQRRYATYFQNMLDGVRPSQPPLFLKRILLSQAPRFARGPPLREEQRSKLQLLNNNNNNNNNKQSSDGGEKSSSDSSSHTTTTTTTTTDKEELLRMGCAPYLQIFKAGKLLHTAVPAVSSSSSSSTGSADAQQQQQQQSSSNTSAQIPFCQVADGSIRFEVNQIVQGDILIRCRHLSSNRRQRVSMFRAAFHTGYVPPNVMRLTKSQLDGACGDDGGDETSNANANTRFPPDFFVDFIFEPVDAEQASVYFEQEKKAEEEEAAAAAAEEEEAAAAAAGQEPVVVVKSKTITASSYDTMLHRDSRFWDVIAKRVEEQTKKQQQQQGDAEAVVAPSITDDNETADNPELSLHLWGPTVGRRRDFSSAAASEPGANTAVDGAGRAGPSSLAAAGAIPTFSIGGELDFLPEPETAAPTKKEKAAAPAPRKRDTLMEALMGALDEDDHDVHDDEHGVEEIVFTEAPKPKLMEVSPTIVQLPPKVRASSSAATATAPAAAASDPDAGKLAAAAAAETKPPAASTTTTTTAPDTNESGSPPTADDDDDDDMDEILANANLELDENMDDLLGGVTGTDNDDDFDVDDDELKDLENFLSPTSAAAAKK